MHQLWYERYNIAFILSQVVINDIALSRKWRLEIRGLCTVVNLFCIIY